jgi:protein ImuB
MRIVSVWLPRWPIQRFLIAQRRCPPREPVDPAQPFVLAVEAAGGPRIAAANMAAEAIGLRVGDLLADARAKVERLQVHAVDPGADDAALKRLALWATRYTPVASPWSESEGADGFFLDVSGAAHLFGGEENLLADLDERLADFGLSARLAIADTAGAAWALSRFHPLPVIALPSGQETEALAPLPVEALRLSSDTCTTLRRLGFKRVGDLLDKPRAPFAARFEKELLMRLDQALGHAAEPRLSVVPPPIYHSIRYLPDPVITTDAVVAIAARLMQDLTHALIRDGVGARALRLSLFRVDGEASVVAIGLSMPTYDVAHVARLIELKLERMAGAIDAGFGFETVGLAVMATEPMTSRQNDLITSAESDRRERFAALIDSLTQRLGPQSVRQIKPIASHLPERAEAPCAVSLEGDNTSLWPISGETCPRPIFLLPHAEPADVIALVPEGPPQRFRWRGVMHSVARAQGPERIASEWWRHRPPSPTRDYYLVEDQDGRRFWLYREGLYGRETRAARWFVHGLFA